MPSFSEPTVNPTRSGDALHVLQKFLLNLPVENEGGGLGWMNASSPLRVGHHHGVGIQEKGSRRIDPTIRHPIWGII